MSHSYFYTIPELIENICYNIYNEFPELTDGQLVRAIIDIFDLHPLYHIYYPSILKCHLIYHSLLRRRIKKMIATQRKFKLYARIIGKLILLQNRAKHRVWAPPNGIEYKRLKNSYFLTESF